jgi:transposase
MLVYEEDSSMTNIGCDIGKSRLDIFMGGKNSKFENSKEGIRRFISDCKKSDNPRVVIEPTGGYEHLLLKELLSEHEQVSIVNPYYVRNFAKSK